MNTVTEPSLSGWACADLLLVLAGAFTPKAKGPDRERLSALPDLADCAGFGHALPPAARTDLAACLEDTQSEAWQLEATALFDATQPCPANECAYIRRDKGNVLADLAGFYRAFGFTRAANAGERLDHLACELEFTALLVAMAQQAPDEEKRAVVREALQAFLGDHLGLWLPAFCGRLRDTTVLPLHAWLAAAIPPLWTAFAVAQGLTLPPPEVLAGEPQLDGPKPVELACGIGGKGE